MASTDTVSAVMFVLSGIVVVGGLVIHYAWPDKTKQESKPNKPRSTLSGVIQLLMIVVGLMIAIAVLDLISMSLGGGTLGAIAPPIEWR
jgi:hypothetical protein